MNSLPKVSIITAAYNRSNVLRYAMESVRRQTFHNWEHIIVGDHCTDDTEAVVTAFDDARIQFVNLPHNSGGQSAPHNHGLAMARGQYVFFLNQDDFYFPDHVASNVAFLERSGADLIWSPVAIPQSTNRHTEDWRDQPILVDGVSANGLFDPELFIISSSWAMRRALADQIGPWRQANETTLAPSQEYLFRAWKKGCVLKYCPHLSVLCIHSGLRRNSYAARDFVEHERYFNLIYKEPDGFARIVEQIALSMAAHVRATQADEVLGALRIVARLFKRRAARWIGVHPLVFANRVRLRPNGFSIASHRRRVLEAPLVRSGDVIRMGDRAADDFLGFGWSAAEGTHRWTENRFGQLAFRLEGKARPDRLLIRGRPHEPQIVEFQVQGQSSLRLDYGDGRDFAEVPLTTTADTISLTIMVSRTVRPRDLNGKENMRWLGFCASQIEFL